MSLFRVLRDMPPLTPAQIDLQKRTNAWENRMFKRGLIGGAVAFVISLPFVYILDRILP